MTKIKLTLIASVLSVSGFLTLSSCDSPTAMKAVTDVLSGVMAGSALTEGEVGGGLREALNVGIKNSVEKVSVGNGFLGDAAIKILFPPELVKVESTLRKIGAGNLVDNAVGKLNEAASDAAKQATPIFLQAIKEMTIQDAFAILKGDNNAATNYLNTHTRGALYNLFKPSIGSSLNKVGAVDVWNNSINKYNQIPLVNKVNPDLNDYVTNKALDGLFIKVAEEEQNIRENPAARVSDLLKRVFGAPK